MVNPGSINFIAVFSTANAAIVSGEAAVQIVFLSLQVKLQDATTVFQVLSHSGEIVIRSTYFVFPKRHNLHHALADDLIRLKYEADKNWLRSLDDVQAITYLCRYPERRPYLKEWEKALRVYFKSRRYLKTVKS